jgi:hypothetical protein
MVDKKLLHLEERAIAGYRLGTAYRWVSCLAAERIVGRYERGAAQEVANALNITVSQVENLARAGLAYRELRRISPYVHVLRERYTISHFTAFANLMYQIEFHPADGLRAWLEMDSMYRDEQLALTVQTFTRLMREEFGQSGKADWEIHLERGSSLIMRAAHDYGMPDHLRQAAQEFLEIQSSPEIREITIQGIRPESWNKFYSGQHWAVRKEEVDKIKALVRAEIDPEQPPMRIPVVIQVYAYFENKPQDSDNIWDKPFIDGLKGWWIPDDDRASVRDVRVRSLVDKRNPRVVIRAYSLPDAQVWEPGPAQYEEMGEL